MATKHQVNKALKELGGELTQQAGKYHYDDFEVIAPEGKVWVANLSEVLCLQYDSDSMTKAEFWDEVLTDIKEGWMDESEVNA